MNPLTLITFPLQVITHGANLVKSTTFCCYGAKSLLDAAQEEEIEAKKTLKDYSATAIETISDFGSATASVGSGIGITCTILPVAGVASLPVTWPIAAGLMFIAGSLLSAIGIIASQIRLQQTSEDLKLIEDHLSNNKDAHSTCGVNIKFFRDNKSIFVRYLGKELTKKISDQVTVTHELHYGNVYDKRSKEVIEILKNKIKKDETYHKTARAAWAISLIASTIFIGLASVSLASFFGLTLPFSIPVLATTLLTCAAIGLTILATSMLVIPSINNLCYTRLIMPRKIHNTIHDETKSTNIVDVVQEGLMKRVRSLSFLPSRDNMEEEKLFRKRNNSL